MSGRATALRRRLGRPSGWLLLLAIWVTSWGSYTTASIVGVLRAARTPLAAGVFFPIGAWMTADILGDAAADLAARRPTVWAGRAYERAAR